MTWEEDLIVTTVETTTTYRDKSFKDAWIASDVFYVLEKMR